MASNTIQVSGPPTIEETALIFLQWLFGTTGVLSDYHRGSIVRTFGEVIGAVDETQGVTAQAQAFQALVYSALNAFGITPNPASASVGKLSIYTANFQPAPVDIQLAAGSVASTRGGIQFTLSAGVLLTCGSVSVDADIQSILTGAITNVTSGAITQWTTPTNFPVTVYNQAPTLGGADAETASQTLSRFLAYLDSTGLCTPIAVAAAAMNAPPNGGEFVRYSTCYEPWITQVLLNQTPTAGFIVYIDNGSGAASSTLLTNVSTYLSSGVIFNLPQSFQPVTGLVLFDNISRATPIGFRPAGVPYYVRAVTPKYCNVSVTLGAVNAATASAIQTSTLLAISSYFASLGFAATAEVSQLTTSIGNVTFGQIDSLTVVLEDSLHNPVSTVTAAFNERVIVQTTNVVVT